MAAVYDGALRRFRLPAGFQGCVQVSAVTGPTPPINRPTISSQSLSPTQQASSSFCPAAGVHRSSKTPLQRPLRAGQAFHESSVYCVPLSPTTGTPGACSPQQNNRTAARSWSLAAGERLLRRSVLCLLLCCVLTIRSPWQQQDKQQQGGTDNSSTHKSMMCCFCMCRSANTPATRLQQASCTAPHSHRWVVARTAVRGCSTACSSQGQSLGRHVSLSADVPGA